MPTLTIDGRTIEVAADTSILDAAAQLDIGVPTLCHHAELSPVGSCRMCVVDVEGSRLPQPACSTKVAEGMKVRTTSPQIHEHRKSMLELFLSRFPAPTNTVATEEPTARCEAAPGPLTEFDRLVKEYGAKCRTAVETRHEVDSDDNPFIHVDLNKCILCTRCVRACNEIQGRFIWNLAERGDQTHLICGNDTSMLEAGCESCGACAALCPTGALEDRMSMDVQKIDQKVRTTCGYCGVGCQFDLNVAQGKVVGVSSTEEAPVNGSSLCVKGRYGYDFLHHPERIRRPRVRKYLLDKKRVSERPFDRGTWVEVDWREALSLVANRFSGIVRESGASAFGVLSSAKCTNEENYLMQKFARQVLGTNNVDHCARLCHSSTVAGLAMAMGSGAMTNSMDDIATEAKAILITGSNTTEQHPVFGAMLRQAALRGTRIVVADPRAIDMVEFAELHLRQRPGTDVALINGIMQLAIENEWLDRDFVESRCEGFNELADTVAAYTPAVVSGITGVPEVDLRAAAELLCTTSPMAVIWSMGITQHTTGVSNVLSLANLQMLLGNMGVAGGGVNPLRGQNNVQGACDLGALPNVYPGYQRVDDGMIAAKFQAAWKLSNSGALDMKPGLTVTELIERAGAGTIRGLYIMGEDPAMTEPDSNHARECLANAEFVVLQEILESETVAYADVLLPGSAYAEKGGTFTNTERRIQPVRRAIDPPGESRADWEIISQLATRMLLQQDRVPTGKYADWNYHSPAEILDEINALTPSYAGVTAARVARGERLQWPVPDEQHAGTPILHVGQFARGKGRFHAVDFVPAAELPDADYPLLLTTGRVLYHWHGGELTRRAEALAAVCPEPMIEVSYEDAIRYELEDGQWVTLASRRGELRARVRRTTRVSEGVVFGNFHFPSGNVNKLTINEVDPIAKIPEYKVCAVRFAL